MDLIDRIDELVDEQLSAGEPEGGYESHMAASNPDPQYPRCGHCGRHWHGLPLTSRVAWMYAHRRMDPNYNAADDDSPIVCDGSDFIGPRRPPSAELGSIGIRREVPFLVLIDTDAFSAALRRMQEQWDRFFESISTTDWQVIIGGRTWTERLTVLHYTEQECSAPAPDVDVTFGPQNWIHEVRRSLESSADPESYWGLGNLTNPLRRSVQQQWDQFTAPDFPVPPSPGYDFSAYAHDIQHGPQHNQILRGRS